MGQKSNWQGMCLVPLRTSVRDGSPVRAYYRDHPLTFKERLLGHSVRLVSCLRSGRGDFDKGPQTYLWIVLSAACGNAKPFALTGSVLSARVVSTRKVDLQVGANQQVWTVHEWVVEVPYKKTFAIKAGPIRIQVTEEALRHEYEAYDGRIANGSVDHEYPQWVELAREAYAEEPVLASDLLMSIVTPVYKTPPQLLREAIQSVVDQTYQRWELVVVNASPGDEAVAAVLGEFQDARIKVVPVQKNLGIVGNTNLGLDHCTGDYVSFFDHDDLLEPTALASFVEAIHHEGHPGLLYCDEDNIDEDGTPLLPLFKPPYNPDLLLNDNYVIHFLTIRRSLLQSIQRSDSDVEGAQDYDLTFKVAETGEKVVRVPRLLYHWRFSQSSTAANPEQKLYAQEAGARAIAAHLERTGADAMVRRGQAYFTYRVDFALQQPVPELLVLAGGTCSSVTQSAVGEFGRRHGVATSFAKYQGMSELCALCADHPHAFVLVITPEHDLDLASLETLVANLQRDEVAAVSPRVVRKDGLIDYAGTLVLPDGTLGRLLYCIPEQDCGYVGRAQRPYDAAVLNGECCLLKVGQLLERGLNARFETVGYALADYCVRQRELGKLNVYLPYATARLNVARSLVGADEDAATRQDKASFMSLHPELKAGDPSHSPNFDPWSLYYQANWGFGMMPLDTSGQ